MSTRTKSLLVVCWLAMPMLFIGVLLAYVGNAADGLRLGGLALPGYVLLYFSIKRTSKILSVLTVFWWAVLMADTVIRSLSWFVYNSDSNAYFIIQALANTTYAEVVEFIQAKIFKVVLGTSLFTLCLLAYFYSVYRYITWHDIHKLTHHKLGRWVVAFLIFIMIASYAIRPTRALFPAVYWTNYYQSILAFQQSMDTHKALHRQWHQKAVDNLMYAPDFAQQQTHVLVMSDSITSINLGVCGYPRNTTPYIEKQLSQLKVFCSAFSPYPSTINSVKSMLTDSARERPDDVPTESILDFAKAADFKVYWLSNQDDAYISSLFGQHASVAIFNNKRSGRSSHALDEELLPLYLEALSDPHPRKLIILHFLGAHPNYSLRYPSQFNHFTTDDEVYDELKARNMGFWIRQQRNKYDNAILYQDWLFSRILDPLQKTTTTKQRSLIFLSDHGNEVGHEKNYAGHSPNTQAGYQVPVIVWHNQLKNVGVNHKTTIDISELDVNLMHLMGLENKAAPDVRLKNWLSEHYQFEPAPNWPYWQ